ncbi:sensor protein KdpD [Lachnospiraceae bacterium]|nr:sensor protein KdpD [Lachnospiraceae bacterium]GFI70447.1 sensor protein KdpD [Lachnospiraceae bacterium]
MDITPNNKNMAATQNPRRTTSAIGKDLMLTALFLMIATVSAFWFFHAVPENPTNIALVYITALVLTARFTNGYFYGIAASVVSVIGINYLFTYPYFQVNFTLTGYPVTFIFTLVISLVVSTMTSRIKEQADALVEREKLLMDAEKEKMRANLLRSVSHDLRTPLTGIIGNSSTYIDNQDSLTEKEKLALVSHIREDSNWLLNMVENLLSVTRISQNSMKIATSLESVEEVVSEAVLRFHKRFPDARVNIQVPEEFLMIPMDAMLIEQVIINLLENSVVHSGSRLPAELTVTCQNRQAAFCIKDYGVGIDPRRLATLFDGSSYSPASSSDGHKGMGIGLSICKTIIAAHNGVITAANHENGCQFTFTLPMEDHHA